MSSAAEVPNAATFLALALPWPEEGQSHFVNVHQRTVLTDHATGVPILDNNGKQKTFYNGKACRNPQEAASYVAWVNAFDNYTGTDIYVCMSGQSQAKEKLDKLGRPNYQAMRSTDNAVIFKGLWVDVDVKGGLNSYPDTRTAVTEFGRIRRNLGLPVPTMLVGSGSGGFHAHWIFAAAVGFDQWSPLAHALVAGLVANGFKGDTGCTIDAARLLRVPDTWNHKGVVAGTGPKTPVKFLTLRGDTYNLDVFDKALAPFKGYVPARAQRATPAVITLPGTIAPIFASTPVVGSLSDNVATTQKVSIVEVAKVCPFVMNTLKTRGRDNTNPLWMTTCSISLFTTEGDKVAHAMAMGHPGYDKVSTDEMLDRVKDTKVRRDLGYPRCKTIYANGGAGCATCPHLAADRSPFNFVVPVVPVTSSGVPVAGTITNLPAGAKPITILPPGYSWGAHGTVDAIITDEEGKQFKRPVVHMPVIDPWLQEHPAVINFTTVVAGQLGTATALPKQIRLPLELLFERSAMAKYLAEQHMVLPSSHVQPFGDFMSSWQETLRKNRDNLVQSAPFGWLRKDGKIVGFIYGKRVWSQGPEKPASNPDPVLEHQFTPTGELAPWIKASRMITDQKRSDLNSILASAFAGPLVTLVGQTGLLMSTYSPESGIGKSTTMRITQAVWGHPVKAVQSLSDTTNSVLKKIGDLKNLPMYWDELKTDRDTERFVQLAFQLAQGKEKSRMSSDTSYRETGTWETILVSTSNDSIINYVTQSTRTTSAGLMRIFEFPVVPGVHGQISAADAQQITANVNNNYGHAGMAYAKFLGANYERVAVEVKEKLQELERVHQCVAEERFWSSLITVIIMGAKYSNELGLAQIDEKELERFMIQKFTLMRGERADTQTDVSRPAVVFSHLSRYLNSKAQRNTIYTNIIWTAAGRPPIGPGGVIPSNGNNSRVDEVLVQMATSTGQCRIMKEPFMKWLTEEQISQRVIMNKLVTMFGAVERRGRLGVGTNWATHAEHVIDFDFSSAHFQGLIDV